MQSSEVMHITCSNNVGPISSMLRSALMVWRVRSFRRKVVWSSNRSSKRGNIRWICSPGKFCSAISESRKSYNSQNPATWQLRVVQNKKVLYNPLISVFHISMKVALYRKAYKWSNGPPLAHQSFPRFRQETNMKTSFHVLKLPRHAINMQ